MGIMRFSPIIHEKGRFVQRQMENTREFMIRLGSVRDVEEFVRISTAQPFPISLDDGQHRVNGKSFMEIFCLRLSAPVTVRAECTQEEFDRFFREAEKFLA